MKVVEHRPGRVWRHFTVSMKLPARLSRCRTESTYGGRVVAGVVGGKLVVLLRLKK